MRPLGEQDEQGGGRHRREAVECPGFEQLRDVSREAVLHHPAPYSGDRAEEDRRQNQQACAQRLVGADDGEQPERERVYSEEQRLQAVDDLREEEREQRGHKRSE